MKSGKADGFENQQFCVISHMFLENLLEKPLARQLSVTLMGYYPRAANHVMKRPQGCGTALMIYCCSGSGFYSINGNPLKVLSAGELVIFPPHIPHEYYASGENPWSIYWVHFKGTSYEPFYQMVSARLPLHIDDIIGDRLKELFNQCFCILQLPYHEEEFLYLCQLVATMLALVSCSTRSIIQLSLSGGQGIEKAVGYMQAHLREEVTLGELAKAARFSTSHLYYLFKHSTGYAPIEFFLKTKIQAAARDLYFSSLTVKDIAMSYGIEDPYYFSRLFKKIMGMSPQNYRNKSKD
jgi:AraC-like DNA-binding protein